VTLGVLSLSAIAYGLLQSLVVPALPDIQRELHASSASVGWLLSAYLLSASVATPIIGRLGDLYGKKRVLVIVSAMVGVGSLLAAVASSVEIMIVGRVIQGAGGGIFPLAFGIIRDEAPPSKVAGGIGFMSSLIGIGGAAGLLLAGAIVQSLSYHWLFWVPLIVITIATVATYVLVPESPVRARARINWLAALLMSLGLTAVLVGLTKTATWGWGSPRTLGLMAGGLVLIAVWVGVELRARTPLVDMRMMRLRGVWATNLAAFMVGMGMYAAFIMIPQYVQEPKTTGYGFGASVLEAGLFLAPWTAMMLIVGQFAGMFERRFGSKRSLLIGGTVAVGGFALLTADRGSPVQIYVASGLLGTGIGFAFAAMANLIVENVPAHQTGVATGMNAVTRTIGGALGAQVAVSLLAGNLGAAGRPTNAAFGIAFVISAVALVFSVGAALLVPDRRKVARDRLAALPAPELAG
jgi:EmrB/QacA subfamily drug resistance transporter